MKWKTTSSGTFLFYSSTGNGAYHDIYVSRLGPDGSFGPGEVVEDLSTPDSMTSCPTCVHAMNAVSKSYLARIARCGAMVGPRAGTRSRQFLPCISASATTARDAGRKGVSQAGGT